MATYAYFFAKKSMKKKKREKERKKLGHVFPKAVLQSFPRGQSTAYRTETIVLRLFKNCGKVK